VTGAGRARLLLWAAFPVVLAVAFSGCAAPLGSIRGTLDPKVVGPDVVVMAWPAGASPAPESHGRVRVSQTSKGFDPHVSVVSPGTTVVFKNEDAVFHNAFCVEKEAPFDVGTYGPGQTRGVRMRKPGTYQVFCELHPKESAYIVVAPGSWHTRPRADGRFSFKDVPLGTYQVRVWRPNKKELLGSAEVKPRETATVRFETESR
jgi:plastocyanin